MRRAGGAPSALVFVQDYDDYDDCTDFDFFFSTSFIVSIMPLKTAKHPNMKEIKSE